MCGIAGYLGPHTIDDARLEACLAAMHHRGPDARGQYTHATVHGRHVYLLHRRLGIIDLEARANQPMRHGTHVLVFNGELYNYRELRQTRGWTNGHLRTRSDTEVLLRVLAESGPAGLDAAEGMWSLALYDEACGALLLARDRFGEKPLYLLEADGGLYFASEVKLIAALRGGWPAINEEQVLRYLVNGYKALYKRDATFFEGLRELPPGSTLHVDPRGRSRVARYWRPPAGPGDEMAYAEAVESVRAALCRAVELRLRADVPLAFCLSGGVDSNALAALARHEFGCDVHGFTIGSRDPRYDERGLVEHAAAALGIRHTLIEPETGGFLERLRALVRRHDAPVYTISYYVQSLLLEAMAREGYRVSISGTGADELFSGYYDHHQAYLYTLRDDGARLREARAAWERRIRPHVRNPYLQDPELYLRSPGARAHIFLDADVIAGFLRRPWHEPFAETGYCPDLMRNRMLNELFHEVVPPILHEDDLNAMAVSMENRSPFLDRGLFEATLRIPTRHLVRDGLAKALLRDAVRGLVPDRVLDETRKVGFNAPVRELLDTSDPGVRAALLDEGPIYDLVRRDRIETLLDLEELPNSRSKFLFSFVSAKLFLEEFAP